MVRGMPSSIYEPCAGAPSVARSLADHASIHADDLIGTDAAVADRSLPGADMVDDRPALSEVHDFADFEFLIWRRKDFVRHGPVPFVHGELDSHAVDPFRPDGGYFSRPRGGDAPSVRLHRGDLYSGVAEIELFTDRDVLLRREFKRCPFGLVEPGYDERDLARLRLPRDDRGRSEEHTSELQSLRQLVWRLLSGK